jgi:hypothetical protein
MSETKSFKEFADNTIGGERAYMYFHLDSKRIKVKKGPRPDRKTSKRFVVKIQSGKEYRHYKKSLNDCVSLIFISTVYDSQTSLHTDLWWLQWFTWQLLEQYVAFPHLPHVSKLSLRT